MYSHVFVAGTFDHLHKGHDAMLTRAFAEGDRVTIGLTSDEFVSKFRSDQQILPFAQRKQGVLDWLTEHGEENRCELIAIHDPYEPAASMDSLDGLMVTQDNRVRGEEVNNKRRDKGLPELALIEVPLVAGENQKPISATQIRSGEIDEQGRLTMPDNLRPELVKPLGSVLVGDAIGSSIEAHRQDVVITVGDITTKTFLTAGVIPNLAIVDFQVARKPFPELNEKLHEQRITVASGPGFIANGAIEIIREWATVPADRRALVVDGEEDLLTLPAVAYGPVGAVVYYGQPDKGLVEVLVTEESKQKAVELLKKFL